MKWRYLCTVSFLRETDVEQSLQLLQFCGMCSFSYIIAYTQILVYYSSIYTPLLLLEFHLLTYLIAWQITSVLLISMVFYTEDDEPYITALFETLFPIDKVVKCCDTSVSRSQQA